MITGKIIIITVIISIIVFLALFGIFKNLRKIIKEVNQQKTLIEFKEFKK